MFVSSAIYRSFSLNVLSGVTRSCYIPLAFYPCHNHVFNKEEEEDHGFHSWAVATTGGTPNEIRRAGERGETTKDSMGRVGREEEVRDEVDVMWDSLAGEVEDGDHDSDDEESDYDDDKEVTPEIKTISKAALFQVLHCNLKDREGDQSASLLSLLSL